MREACFNEIVNQARTNDKIWLVTADMGYGLVDAFAKEFPDRYINVGVAEQNMIGVAAGLALSGKVVFCYSIGVFPTLRCLEQIRNDVCYHNLNVNIIAGGTGLTYGPLGFTHHAIEDIAVMRVLPNMTVLAPGTPEQAKTIVIQESRTTGPSYTRLGISDAGMIDYYSHPQSATDASVAVLSTGTMLGTAILTSSRLTSLGIGNRLRQFSQIRSLPVSDLLDAVRGTSIVVAMEEHSVRGGFASTVAELLAGFGNCPKMIHIGVQSNGIPQTAHTRDELFRMNGMDADSVVQRVLDAQ